MKNTKLVVGHLLKDQVSVKSVPTSKQLSWIKYLDPDELSDFFDELLKLVIKISDGKKSNDTLTDFLDEWKETALLNSEAEVKYEIAEAESELDAGGGKEWEQIKEEIGL